MMRIGKGELATLHVMLHGVVFAGIASIFVKRGPHPLILIAALVCFIAAPPLFLITKRKVDREPDTLSFPMFFSQLGLIIFWILSLCFLIIMAMFFVAIAQSGLGPGD
jgi:hypothetical protein